MSAESIIATIFGFIFIIALFAVGVYLLVLPKDKPVRPEAMFIFRVILALAAAAIGAVIPGFLGIEVSLGQGLIIRATGAIALFLVIYLFDPPGRARRIFKPPNLEVERGEVPSDQLERDRDEIGT